MESKSFTDCTLVYLEETFDLTPAFDSPVMHEWLKRPADISDFERQELLGFQELLALNVGHWNEQELSLNFIGPLFALVRFTTLRFNLFAQRPLRAAIGEVELYGRPDAFIATGFRAPKIPFFAFNEYKKLTDPNGDPAGQCLAAMLVGQAMNRADGAPRPGQPIYGCHVIGDLFRFTVLDGQQYATSPGYSATSDDLFDIYRILKALKQLVIERTS